ncbi:MAG: hypothetical protein Q3999_07905, partial [Buchananella hordeovulneris]|nr:hypothetical protein [Buchananella hordeovulneris]
GERSFDRGERPQRQDRPSQGLYSGPEFPADVTDKLLDRPTRMRLRTLSERSAEVVAKHLVMVQRHLATDPELAWAHAEAAVRNAGRVDVVREAAALAAYASGRFADTLREVRALRRLSGRHVHIAIEADAERALGRPEKALEIIAGAERYTMDVIERAELAMVASGVRADMGELEAALVAVEDALDRLQVDQETMLRLQSVRADRLRELGREAEADALVEEFGLNELEEEDVEVFDVEEESAADIAEAEAEAAAQSASDEENVDDVAADAPLDEGEFDAVVEENERAGDAEPDAAELDADDLDDAELLQQAQDFDIDAEVDELLAEVEAEIEDAGFGEDEDLFQDFDEEDE